MQNAAKYCKWREEQRCEIKAGRTVAGRASKVESCLQ